MKADMHGLARAAFIEIKGNDVACTGCGTSLRERLQHQCHPRVYVHPSGDAYCTKGCMIRHMIEGTVMISKYCPLHIEIGAVFTIDDLEREIITGFQKWNPENSERGNHDKG